MGTACAVRGCRSARVNGNKNIHFHSLPKDKELKQKWIDLCGIRKKSSAVYICSLHFETAAFERNLKYELLGLPVPPGAIRFKQGAVPTLHLPNKEDHPCVPHPDVLLRDIEVVVVKEEHRCTEEGKEVHPPQEQDPLSINPEPVSWEPSHSQEKPHPKGREIQPCSGFHMYIKEEMDIKEEVVGD